MRVNKKGLRFQSWQKERNPVVQNLPVPDALDSTSLRLGINPLTNEESMSHFTESQSARLCAAVDRYAKQQGFIAAGESVPVQECFRGNWKYILRFSPPGDSNVDHARDVAIVNGPEETYFESRAIFPCGQQLDGLVKKVAKAVVHELFDPQ